MGFAIATSDRLLNELLGGVVFLQLHIGEPGPDCSSNVAQTSVRQPGTFSMPEDGTVTSTTDAEWDEAAADETVTHGSLWDGAGRPVLSGQFIDPIVLQAGVPFSVPAGWMTATLA